MVLSLSQFPCNGQSIASNDAHTLLQVQSNLSVYLSAIRAIFQECRLNIDLTRCDQSLEPKDGLNSQINLVAMYQINRWDGVCHHTTIKW
jgi:hypothetical protein